VSGADFLGAGVQQVGETDHGTAQLVATAVHQLHQHMCAQLGGGAPSHLKSRGGGTRVVMVNEVSFNAWENEQNCQIIQRKSKVQKY